MGIAIDSNRATTLFVSHESMNASFEACGNLDLICRVVSVTDDCGLNVQNPRSFTAEGALIRKIWALFRVLSVDAYLTGTG